MRNKYNKLNGRNKKSSSRKWLKSHINDNYVQKSKLYGYRSRSSFKLLELNDKFNFIKKNKIILDLGSSPGGWSQVISEILVKNNNNKDNINIFAVDILDMQDIEYVNFLQQDFMAIDAKDIITQFIKNNIKDNIGKDNKLLCDVIISDMAPNMIGDKQTDHLRMINMIDKIWDFTKDMLNHNGIFVAKIFHGAHIDNLVKELKKHFINVKLMKPKSSKKQSKEIYIYCAYYNKLKI